MNSGTLIVVYTLVFGYLDVWRDPGAHRGAPTVITLEADTMIDEYGRESRGPHVR